MKQKKQGKETKRQNKEAYESKYNCRNQRVWLGGRFMISQNIAPKMAGRSYYSLFEGGAL